MTLEQKYKTYLNLLPSQQDEHGFIESEECDSLLFSGLLGSCQGVSVKIDAAYDKLTDEWMRRPVEHGSCYDPSRPENQQGFFSKLFDIVCAKLTFPLLSWEEIVKAHWYRGSTISRDMLLGLAWYAWYNKRLDISESVIKRALSHFGVMGRGDPSRINIMPALLSTFAWISYRLGGPSRPWLRVFKPYMGGKLTDFQAHLQVLHVMLRQTLEKKGPSRAVAKVLRYHANRQPNNALFQFAAGNRAAAERLLRDTVLWPQDRLPSRKDRHEPWIFQRDFGADWLPAAGDKTHSGGDFIFLYSLLHNRMKHD